MSSFSSSRRAGREACFYGAQRDHPSPRRSSHTRSGCFKICVRPTAKASSLFLSPFARQFLVLSLEDARSILEDTPELFTPAIDGKARALAHFEPIVSLIIRGSKRAPRRDFNERILETDRRQHNLAENWNALLLAKRKPLSQAALTI